MFRSERFPDSDPHPDGSITVSPDVLPFTWEVGMASVTMHVPRGDSSGSRYELVLVSVRTPDSLGVMFVNEHGCRVIAQRRPVGQRNVEHVVVFGRDDGRVQVLVWGIQSMWEGTFWLRPDTSRVEGAAFGLVERAAIEQRFPGLF